jgi:hypothetical protein
MNPPASRLVATLRTFQEQCGDEVQAAVAFAGYLVTQKDTLDKTLLNGDGGPPDKESISLYLTMATQALDEYTDSAIEEFVPDFERELRSKQLQELRERFDERSSEI